MGSISREARCARFREKLEKKIIAAASNRVGDFLEIVGATVGMTDDGTDVSKIFFTVKNKRSGDETVMEGDSILFAAEDDDESNVSRLQSHLYEDMGFEKLRASNRKKAIKLLKDAKLIDPKYEEKP